MNNAYITLVSANGSTFIYEVLAIENLPASSLLSINLNYQQLDANLNVVRDIGVYETPTYAFNGVNHLVSTTSVLVDTAACSGTSSSAITSSSSVASSSSSSSPSIICETQTGADTGTANLGFGIMAGHNVYLSLQLRNADYASPIQVNLENADVMEIFASSTKRIFQVSALQTIPSSANVHFNYGYQQLDANQSVWRDVAIHDTATNAVYGSFPLSVSNTQLVDATHCN